MAMLRLYLYPLVILLSSCSINPIDSSLTTAETLPSILKAQSVELLNIAQPKVPIVVAVYPNSFTDQTGQRKSNSEFALFSTALTQAPNHLLIRSLKNASNGKFFRVAERVWLDNLTKERQLIRSTRENFEEDQKLQPLLFAGLIIQGGVISYDTNIQSGGIGARYLGIGNSKQYREDVVTISLRLVSVSTGEILMESAVSKNILSTSISQDIFRFIEQGTELVEIEGGVAENEVGSIALQKAIETGVLNLIEIGIERGYWEYETINIDEPSCDDDCIANIRG